MHDFKEILDFYESFKSSPRNNFEREVASSSGLLKKLRIRYWYGLLRERNGLKSAYQMEKFFEPDSFVLDTNDSIIYSKNKWIGYRDGLHLPQKNSQLLRDVEKKCPGSTRELNHPLWSVLDLENTQIMQGDSFLRQLIPAVQEVLFIPDKASTGYLSRTPITKSLLNKLERRACLDVLACLVWLLRETADKKGNEAERVLSSLHNVLIFMALDLYALNIAIPLLNIFTDSIFPIRKNTRLKFSMTPSEYIESSGLLNIISCQIINSSRRKICWTERVRVMNKLIRGDYGLDIPLAIRPSLKSKDKKWHSDFH